MSNEQEFLDRAEWNAYMHDYTALSHGLDPGAEHTILPPAAIGQIPYYAPLRNRATAALHRAIQLGTRQDGTLDADLAALGTSPNWNALASGVEPEPRHKIETDQIVQSYLANRVAKVNEADQALRRQYPDIARTFRNGVAAGIKAGYIPGSVTDRVDDAVRLTAIQITDEGLLPGFGGMGIYDNLDDLAQVSHDLDDSSRIVVTIHELLHKLSGGTFRHNHEDRPIRTRVGFSDQEDTHDGLTEAVDHHMTFGCISGDFSTLDPDQRHDAYNHIYHGERKLLAVLIERSGGIMQLKTITCASFEDNFDTLDRRRMIREARAAYGGGIFRAFDELCKVVDTLDINDVDYRKKLDALIARIHAPTFNPDGTVQESGSIDLQGLNPPESEAA